MAAACEVARMGQMRYVHELNSVLLGATPKSQWSAPGRHNAERAHLTGRTGWSVWAERPRRGGGPWGARAGDG